eukprot:12461166-Alexandrium_andersonii.AAC.1
MGDVTTLACWSQLQSIHQRAVLAELAAVAGGHDMQCEEGTQASGSVQAQQQQQQRQPQQG